MIRFHALALACLLACPALLRAGVPVTYYDTANTASATQMRASLNAIVSNGAVELGYSNTTQAIYAADEDPANPNNVLLMYGRGTRAKSASGGSNDGNALTGGWNREHMFPQSKFSSAEPMQSDIHALAPCDADVNSARLAYPYDTVASPTYTDAFGNRHNGSRWEPADVDKGRAARAILYMDVRYEGRNGEADLVVINSYPGPTGSNEMAYLNTLLTWHRLYPPGAFERVRNQKAYNRQGNANPFVDHPEWAARVWGGSAWVMGNGDTLTVAGVNRAPTTPRNAGALRVPLLTLNLGLAAREFHIASIAVDKLGTIADDGVTELQLWWDVDNNGTVSSVDTLLDTRTFSGGMATFALSHPFYVAAGTTNLLVTASASFLVTGTRTLGVRVRANGIEPHISGGADTAPVFGGVSSGLVTITGVSSVEDWRAF